MSNPDPHRVKDIAALRAIIGEEIPGLAEKNIDYIDDYAREFLTTCPFLVLSTADAEGHIDASPKGDAPGFVEVVDTKTLLIPDRPGNKLAYGHQNILRNPHVGILFITPNTSETLRINGKAELSADPDLLEQLAARGKPATLVIRVHVEECFFHCAKAFIRSDLWKPATWASPRKISFGEMFAKRRGETQQTAETIDKFIAEDYKQNL